MNAPPGSASPDRTDWFESVVLVVLLFACGAALSPNTVDPDLWGHVRYGLDAWEHGLPATATYTYTAPDQRWINHENLSELTLALGVSTIGIRGLLILKCLFGVGLVAWIAWKALRGGVPLVVVCLSVALFTVNLAPYWSMRPQLATFLCCGLMFWLLDYCFASCRNRWRLPWLTWLARDDAASPDPTHDKPTHGRLTWLWCIVPLMLVWTNSHGGFLAGLCLFTAYLACRGFEELTRRGWEAIGLVTRLGMFVAVAWMTSLMNPYGIQLHLWLLESLGSPRPEIAEWGAPSLTNPQHWAFWGLCLTTIVSWACSRRPLDFTQVAVTGAILYEAVQHQRHIAFAALAFGFWVIPHVGSVAARFLSSESPSTAPRPLWQQAALGIGLACAVCVLGWRLWDRLAEMPVRRDLYPVAAFEYIAREKLRGRMVVSFDWAQYAIAAFGRREGRGGVLVAFDGRFRTCYPQEVIDANFDLLLGPGGPDLRHRGEHSPPFDATRALEWGRPDLALLDRHQPHATERIRKEAGWTLLYQDAVAELWGRKDRFNDPRSDQYLPPRRRVATDAPESGSVPWPALPAEPGRTNQLTLRFDLE